MEAKLAVPFHVEMLYDFFQSFVEGNRWLLYLKGLLVTFEVTLLALVIGVVLGVLVAVVRTMHDQQRAGAHFQKRALGAYMKIVVVHPPKAIAAILSKIFKIKKS